MDYLNPLGNNLVYCLAVEKLLAWNSQARAVHPGDDVELQRISSHLVWLGTHAIRPGGDDRFSLLLPGARRDIEAFRIVSGQRMMTSTFESVAWHLIRLPAGGRQLNVS